MNKPAAQPAQAASHDRAGLVLGAILKAPNGNDCQQMDDKGGTKPLTLGDYVYMLLMSARPGDAKIQDVLRDGALAQRVAEGGIAHFTADEVQMIKAHLAGQPASLLWGLLSLIDPESIARARKD